MKGHILTVMLIVFLPACSIASLISEPTRLVDSPSAGVVPKGSFDTALYIFEGGGIIGSFSIGLISNLNLGVSYGALHVIGRGEIDWNRRVELNMKYRLINESLSFPALALGYESQGFGPYYREDKRFATKSKGLYGVLSKNIPILAGLGLHGGVNKSFEGASKDRDLSLFTGIDLACNRQIALLAEYDFAFNDDVEDDVFGKGEGYLNAGIRWAVSDQFFIEFIMKDFLENGESVEEVKVEEVSREIRIHYRTVF
jgi:hypothetical protein